MSALVASITGGGLEVTAHAYRNGEASTQVAPPRGARVVGRDPLAQEVGWVHVEARRLTSGANEAETWVPYYQPTLFVAASVSLSRLAIGVEQAILIVSVVASGGVSMSNHQVPSPVRALVALEGGFVAIHEAGGDLLSDDGMKTHVTGTILQWQVVGAEIRYFLEGD